MTETSPKFICPSCNAVYDPYLRYCTKCGVKLPAIAESIDKKKGQPSGKDRGIEPFPNALYDEPSYTSGRGSQFEEEPGTIAELKPYAGIADLKTSGVRDEDKEDKPPPPPNSKLVGLLLIVAFIVPPAGLITSIIWTIMPSYRKAVVPAILATIIGGGLWGWGAWADMRKNGYLEPVKTIEQYTEAQDLALATRGHFLSLLDLKMDGYLPSDFPEESNIEFEILEHVLGPTGYVIEFRPGFEESRFFSMESLWTDQSGRIRIGSIDGPELQQ